MINTLRRWVKAPAMSALTYAEEPVQPTRAVLLKQPTPAFRRGFLSLVDRLPDPDTMIRDEGHDIYDRMLGDGHLAGAWRQVERRVLSKDWNIRPPEDLAGDDFASEVAAYASRTIRNELALRFDLETLMEAPTHKWAIAGLSWRQADGVWVPASLTPLSTKDFGFNNQGQLLVKDPLSSVWSVAPDMKYVYWVHRRTSTSVYGSSVLAPCYWAWRLKNAGVEFWAMALDKTGLPNLIALIESLANDEDGTATQALVDVIAEKLAPAAAGDSIALGGVKEVKMLGGMKDAGGFDLFCDYMNAEMSKAVMSSTLALEEGRKGRGERGDTSISDEIVEFTARWFGSGLSLALSRSLVRWTVYMKYGAAGLAASPEFGFDFLQAATWAMIVDCFENGVPLSRQALFDKYLVGLQPTGDDDRLVANAEVGVAGSDPLTLSDLPALLKKLRPRN